MKFVYGFGFETPRQRALNDAKGFDDEDSAAVIIEAETAEAALQWGRAVAEEFLKWLYDDPTVSWAADQYADWVEAHQRLKFTAEQSRKTPTVRVGQMPPFDRISAHSQPQPGRS